MPRLTNSEDSDRRIKRIPANNDTMAKTDRRSGTGPMPSLKTARDVVALLAEQVAAVRDDLNASTVEKARAIGYLATVALRAIEIKDLDARVEALESVLKARRGE